MKTIFTINTINKSVRKLKSGIKAPYKSVQYSTLGGEDRVSILILISLDKKSSWSGGYVENSS